MFGKLKWSNMNKIINTGFHGLSCHKDEEFCPNGSAANLSADF
jgi:hypothetical protein